MTPGGGGNALIREGIHAQIWVDYVAIPGFAAADRKFKLRRSAGLASVGEIQKFTVISSLIHLQAP